MAKAKRSAKGGAAVEWVGGIAPVALAGDVDAPPVPMEVLFWVVAQNGVVAGVELGPQGTLEGGAADHLAETLAAPKGGARAPRSVRVATEGLAQALEARFPELTIVRGATPEIDEVAASMRAHFAERVGGSAARDERPAATPGPSFFNAAAALYRARPWESVPDDQSLIGVTIEALGVHDAVVSVIGRLGQEFGFLVFRSVDDFDAYLEVAGSAAPALGRLPSFYALNFYRGAEVPAKARAFVRRRGFTIAGPNAYPAVDAFGDDGRPRGATHEEYAVATLLAQVLAMPIPWGEHFERAYREIVPWRQTVTVASDAGPVEVRIVAPYVPARDAEGEEGGEARQDRRALVDAIAAAETPAALRAATEAFERSGAELTDTAAEPFEAKLRAWFEASPEAQGIEDASAIVDVLHFGRGYFGRSIFTLEAAQLEEIVFRIVPRKVIMDADEGAPFIVGVRAFYTYMARAFGLPQAEACLEVVMEGAEEEFEEALSDSSNFGMGKAILSAGLAAGFDIESEAGLSAFMDHVTKHGLPPGVQIPGLPPAPLAPPRPRASSAKQGAARKSARKAAAASRKKNRGR